MNLKLQQAYFNELENRYSLQKVRRYKVVLQDFFGSCKKLFNEISVDDIREWMGNMTAYGLKPRSIQIEGKCNQIVLSSFDG